MAPGDVSGARAIIDRQKSVLVEQGDPRTTAEDDTFASDLLSIGGG
jgi:hypothetical protein